MSLINLIPISALGDERGSLVSMEANKNIPFDIERVYCLFDTREDVSRGFHAHKELKQVVVCLSGSCRFVLDDGEKREEILLDRPTTGLVVEGLIWREMHDFSSDCVLMVLADQHYDESDYIRDYQEFLNVTSQS
ncbi:MAG: dTDP-4-dehydrorhamnose 3,5-epimerase [Thiomicrorhabdus sp.]|nr:MAG: dTDP-4-dehydrorhamnose 3,5-epimerase [Thiomicrorhabdus sp.]